MDTESAADRSLPKSMSIEPVSFSGNAGEYFRIWIVNMFLTIVTFGLYSPWAKVRRNKYLYRHTQFDGAGFDYHADPIAILKGRLIAVVILGVYLFSSNVLPLLNLLIFLLLLLIMPWLLVRGRMFAMRNTSYRNVRFRFRRIYAEAFKVIVGFSLVVALTFGLAYPWARYRRAKMIIDNTAYGTLDMKLGDEVGAGSFFAIYFGVGLLLMLVLIPVLTVTISAINFEPPADGESPVPGFPGFSFAQLALQGVSIIFYITAFYLIDYAVTRTVCNWTRVGNHRLRCDWSLPKMLLLQLTNLIAIIFSAGLLIPWATIRMTRYKLSNLSAVVDGDLASIAAAEAEEVSALGEEMGEAFDFDFGF